MKRKAVKHIMLAIPFVGVLSSSCHGVFADRSKALSRLTSINSTVNPLDPEKNYDGPEVFTMVEEDNVKNTKITHFLSAKDNLYYENVFENGDIVTKSWQYVEDSKLFTVSEKDGKVVYSVSTLNPESSFLGSVPVSRARAKKTSSIKNAPATLKTIMDGFNLYDEAKKRTSEEIRPVGDIYEPKKEEYASRGIGQLYAEITYLHESRYEERTYQFDGNKVTLEKITTVDDMGQPSVSTLSFQWNVAKWHKPDLSHAVII